MPDQPHQDRQASDDAELLIRYLDGQLSEEQFAAFNDRLKGDALLRHRLIDLMLQAQHIESLVAKSDLQLVQQALLDQSVVEPMRLAGLVERYRVAAIVSVAAVLVLALTVFLVFRGISTPPTAPTLTDFDRHNPVPTSTYRPVVATLTDAVGAQWRSDDKPVPMPMGAQLVAFERFTLTHGFAEITTRRGAVALIQAPATIELTGSDNAIRLHSGKLAGKCLTQASKGFAVHAPGMDVVDLGTEFGVEADAAQGSTVLVMNGAVRAQPTERSPKAFEPVVLEQSQACRVAPETGALDMIATSEAPVFYQETPHPYEAAVVQSAPVLWLRQSEEDPGSRLGNARYSVSTPGFGVLELDGQGCSDLGDVLDFASDQAFSVGVWVRPEASYGDMFILGRIDLNDERGLHGYDLYLKAMRPRFQLKHTIGGAIDSVTIDPALLRVEPQDKLKIDQWQHLAVSYDGSGEGSGVRMYVNGVRSDLQVLDDSLEGKSIHADTGFRVGIRGHANPQPNLDAKRLALKDVSESGSPLVGGVGDLVVYDRALNEEEIKSLHSLSRDAYPITSEGL